MNSTSYDLYINAVFYTGKNSIWQRQTKWSLPKKEAKNHILIEEILDKKRKENDNVIYILKKSKSVFKGWIINSAMLNGFTPQEYLYGKDIEEVHIVGLDTNDCVLATAYEAFDLGFFTYVIEECVQSSEGNNIHKKGIDLLRHLGLTNKNI